MDYPLFMCYKLRRKTHTQVCGFSPRIYNSYLLFTDSCYYDISFFFVSEQIENLFLRASVFFSSF